MKVYLLSIIFIISTACNAEDCCDKTAFESKDEQIEHQLIVSIEEAVKKINDQRKTMYRIKTCHAIIEESPDDDDIEQLV